MIYDARRISAKKDHSGGRTGIKPLLGVLEETILRIELNFQFELIEGFETETPQNLSYFFQMINTISNYLKSSLILYITSEEIFEETFLDWIELEDAHILEVPQFEVSNPDNLTFHSALRSSLSRYLYFEALSDPHLQYSLV